MTEPTINPLQWPPGTWDRVSLLERVFWWVPIVGWIIAAFLYRARLRPVWQVIASQLRVREPCWEQWPPAQREIAKALARIIADEIGWPNDHFIPTDPLKAMLFCPIGDGGEGLAIFRSIDALLSKRGLRKVPAKLLRVSTFGEFVEGLENPMDVVRDAH